MLNDGINPFNILVVTFTNKAAENMRDVITYEFGIINNK